MRVQHHRAALGTAVASIAVLALGAPASGQVRAPGIGKKLTYEMQPIGTFGGTNSRANDLNNAGQVVGSADDADGNYVAFLWEKGNLKSLGTLPGYTGSIAQAIDEKGVIVGAARTSNGLQMAFIWSDDQMTSLGTLGGEQSGAIDLNDDEVVGWAMVEDSSRRFQGFRDQGISMAGQGVLPGGTWSGANAINERGKCVGGSSSRRILSEAVVFQRRDGLDVLPGLTGLGGASGARDINGKGVIVGWAETGRLYQDQFGDRWGRHATRWIDGVVTDLRTLGGSNSIAYSVNAGGDVVGYATNDVEEWRAVLWAHGRIFDLNDRLARPIKGSLISAEAINDQGQIVATHAFPSGKRRAVLLTPAR